MLDEKTLFSTIENQWDDSIIPSLYDYIKIPNKSPHFDDDWEKHGFMEQAIRHIAKWCLANGPKDMTLDIVRLPHRTPLLFIEIPGSSEETILLYGHLDKQPEMVGWREGLGPWTPVLKDGYLYGRGGADDGYAAYASLSAIAALQAQGLNHGRCIMMIEACEESGSFDLPFYLELLKDRIGSPSLVICLDSGAGNYEQLWITTSLRGNVVGDLSVELLEEGIHSGYASGIVADSFRVAKQLLNRIEDGETGQIKLSSLYCDIPEQRMREADACASVLGDRIFQDLPLCSGVKPIENNHHNLLLNRTWRPALTVTGADGFPPIANAGNVMRPKTSLKLSMRLPPLVSSKTAYESMKSALIENPPYHAKVSFNKVDAAQGWNAPGMAEWLSHAVNQASLAFFQRPAMYIGEGGTIPFMGMLGEKFPEAQFVITGVLGPHSNAHGPNEFLHIDMAKRITACVAYILYQHGLK